VSLLKHLPLLLFLLLSVGSLFWIPANQQDLYRAPSTQWLWSSRHLSLGEELPELVEHPILNSLMKVAGVEEEDVSDLLEEENRFWWKQLLPAESLIIQDAAVGPLFEDVWVVMSRVGFRQVIFRLWSEMVGVEGWVRENDSRGRVLFSQDVGHPRSLRWMLVLNEGWLVAVYARHPDAAWQVIDRMDGIRASANEQDQRRFSLLAPHEGTWSPLFLPGLDSGRLRIDAADPSRLRIRADGPAFHPFTRQSQYLPDSSKRMVGGNLRAKLWIPPGFGHLFQLPQETQGQLFLMSPPYQTRLRMLPLPAVLLQCVAANQQDAQGLTRALMLQIQQLSGLSWLEVPPKKDIWSYESNDSMVNTLWSRSQQPAATWESPDSLWFSSSRSALQKLVKRNQSAQAKLEARDATWADANLVAWMDVQGLLEDISQPLSWIHQLPIRPGAAVDFPLEEWMQRLESLKPIREFKIEKIEQNQEITLFMEIKG